LLQPWKDLVLRRRTAPQRSGSRVEPRTGDLVSDARTGTPRSLLQPRGARPLTYRSGAGTNQDVAPRSQISMSAPRTRARGDEQLSARKGSETEGAGHPRHSKKSKPSDRSARKGDLGRALRTVYDDTLREPVPDDLLKIIGKLG